VEQAVPLIYTRDRLPPPMSLWTRLLAAGLAGVCLAMLVVGMNLRPNGEKGVSTHTELGLPPCQFEQKTGLPCPSCGFTTSVSFFAHGNVLASIYIQPMGFVIALFAAASVWVGGYIALTGKPVHRLMLQVPGRMWLIGLLSLAIVAWGWKIAIHLTGHDHWPIL
jgi:hypothetical protein